jgi:hypothetical protein
VISKFAEFQLIRFLGFITAHIVCAEIYENSHLGNQASLRGEFLYLKASFSVLNGVHAQSCSAIRSHET